MTVQPLSRRLANQAEGGVTISRELIISMSQLSDTSPRACCHLRRLTGPRAYLAALGLLWLAVPCAAEPPRIVRVRLPSTQVVSWFPPGTELRMLAPEKLDELVNSARRVTARPGTTPPPRLIRAHHQARWDAGVLIGRSELIVQTSASGGGSSIVALDPWTPAILSFGPKEALAGALESGEVALALDRAHAPASSTVTLEWTLRALPDTRGRRFKLGLPGDDASVLTLDLPAELTPVGPRGDRLGPVASSRAGMRGWRFHGRPGHIDLQLTDALPAPGAPASRDSLLIWVSGATRIDLGASDNQGGKFANWVTDWSVQVDPRGALQFAAELDPELELVTVSGPNVKEYQSQRQGSRTLVKVSLSGEPGQTAQVRFEAHAIVPLEGPWSVPAICPLDAIWTGGTTTVILDENHVVQECSERSGRQVPAPAGLATDPTALVFEARSPGSVADLVIGKPRVEGSCLVRGRLFVGKSVPQLECRIMGLGGRGSRSELSIDLPSTWVADRLQWSGVDEPVAWHSKVRDDGGTTLRILLTRTEKSPRTRTLIVGATSSVPAGRGPLVLPRVRPSGVAVSDEVWVAMVDKAVVLTPASARGLAWVDPAHVEGLVPPRAPFGTDLRTALAWRWNSKSGAATVDRVWAEPEPTAEIEATARIDQGGQRLSLDGRIIIKSGNEPGTILPVWISESAADPDHWSFQLENDGRELMKNPLSPAASARYEFPRDGTAWELPLDSFRPGQYQVGFKALLPWKGNGPIPIVLTPKQFVPRGMVLVETPQRMLSRAEASGLLRIDVATAARLSVLGEPATRRDAVAGADRHPYLLAHAFTYTGPGKLGVSTEELTTGHEDGVVREARLTSVLYPRGPQLNRLRLLVSTEQRTHLGFTLPAGVSLARVRLEGVDVVPVRELGRMVISLPPGQGQKRVTLDLDYELTEKQPQTAHHLEPVLPVFDIPCLSFCWEVIAPPSWRPTYHGGGLLANDYRPRSTWPLGPLGLGDTAWPGGNHPSHAPSQETLRRLDKELSSTSLGDLSFAECFTRWDSGQPPLIVDRLAMSDSGRGPMSRCLPVRGGAEGQGDSRRTLEQYGLSLVAVDTALVVTSRSEAARPGAPQCWELPVGEAVLWGADRSDRFQSVPRWRGEATPKLASRGESAGGPRRVPGRRAWRFTADSWPDRAAAIGFTDERSDLFWGWIVAALVVFGLGWWPRLQELGTITLPIAISLVPALFHVCFPDLLVSVSAGAFAGGITALLFRLGSGIAWPPGLDRGRERSAFNAAAARGRGVVGSALRGFLILVAVVLARQARAWAPSDQEPPVFVLLPYDGVYVPGQNPRNVFLRQSDYERLKKLSEPESQQPAGEILLTAAAHRITWSGDHEAILQSDLELHALGTTATVWRVPITGIHEISATLGGRPAPVVIEQGGQQAAIPIPGPGRFRIRFRGSKTAIKDGTSESVDFPINPMPSASLIVDRPPRPIRLLSGRGGSRAQADQSIATELGPTDRIELRWGDPELSPAAPSGTVESVLLWDIEPAGDRLRGRLTYHGQRRLPALSFRVDPGLVPRAINIPGMVSASWTGSKEKPLLTAWMDPPLQDGATIALDVWRPAPSHPPVSPANITTSSIEGEQSPRRLPLVEPIGIERYSGLLGVRRPGHWTGRLDSVPGVEPQSDESFVKSWGPLPDEMLTLSGTTRITTANPPIFRTGPPPTRIKIRPVTQLRFEAGRIDLHYDAELTELSGSLVELTVEIPRDLVILGIDSDNLTTWNRPNPGRLVLRYDRSFARSKRRLIITGWLPVVEDPLKVGPQRQRVPTPWLKVPGTESFPGLLIVSSTSKVEAVDAPGLIPEPVSPLEKSKALASRSRQTYQVDDPAKLGELNWTSPPPRVTVLVESQLTIQPDSAEWVAVLRYDVLGGPVDSIHLKVPTAWTANAQIEMSGNSYDLKTDPHGPITFWSITPHRPIWGTERVVLRSNVPQSAGTELQYPEVIPLGRGAADTFLGLVSAAGKGLTTTGATGLRSVTYASRFRAEEFGGVADPEPKAFHVEHDNWSLFVQIPQASAPRLAEGESARLASADLDLTVMPDHAVVGSAVYETKPRTGRFLRADLPPASTFLWATVDQGPVTPLKAADGRWLIPLGTNGPNRVSVFWSQRPEISNTNESGWALTLPRAGVGGVSTLVTVHHPGELAIKPSLAGLEPASPGRLDLERASRIARQISDLLGQIDRASGRDRERISSLLASHESLLRAAERSLKQSQARATGNRGARAEHDLEVIQEARRELAQSLRAAGFDKEAEDPKRNPGDSSSPEQPAPARIAASEPAPADRIRGLGQPTFLIGLSGGPDQEPIKLSVVVEKTVSDEDWRERARSIAVAAFLIALGLAAMSPARGRRTTIMVLAGILAFIGFVGGPLLLAAAAITGAAGWYLGARPQPTALDSTPRPVSATE
jgi:hypothetical protein